MNKRIAAVALQARIGETFRVYHGLQIVNQEWFVVNGKASLGEQMIEFASLRVIPGAARLKHRSQPADQRLITRK